MFSRLVLDDFYVTMLIKVCSLGVGGFFFLLS